MKMPEGSRKEPIAWALARSTSAVASVVRARIAAGDPPAPQATVFRRHRLYFALAHYGPERPDLLFKIEMGSAPCGS